MVSTNTKSSDGVDALIKRKSGKRFAQISAKVDKEKVYSLSDAVKIVKDTAIAKFDETIDISLLLGLDRKKTDQVVKGVVALPHGTGKTIKIAAFVNAADVESVKKAGADYTGGTDLVEQIQGGLMDFDCVIASPDMMPSIAKLGPVLGPKGLMPNPKVGTVTKDVKGAVTAFKKGQVRFKSNSGAYVQMGIGKAGFDANALEENIKSAVEGILREKPKETLTGPFAKRLFLSSTMGVGIEVDLSTVV